jgi:pimeloyl-ACP methyl ester carboxylesterase
VIVTDFILVPGAGGLGTPYWRHASKLFEGTGHRAIPVDLPGDDADAGLPEYAAMITDAVESCTDPVVVAQSMGAFSAVMACDRTQVRGLVLVNAMVPAPGETPGGWWETTGAVDARVAAAEAGGYDPEFTIETYFLHDLDADDAAAVLSDPGAEADVAFGQTCDVAAWPNVPTSAVIGRDDRLFPPEFQHRLVDERVGAGATVVPGGHLLALANPEGLVEAILDVSS